MKAEITFNFNGIKTIILGKENEKMKDICNKYATKAQLDSNNLYFLYNGDNINLDSTFNETVNCSDKEINKMNILVYEKTKTEEKTSDKILVKSKEIICPKCGENCLINMKDFKISLFDFKNNHKISNISINQFDNTQNIDEEKIICEICKENNKNNSYNKRFYRCLNCSKNLCTLCNSKHDSTHNIIDYNKRHYICSNHNDSFISFCTSCNSNLCISCQSNHDMKHKITNYVDILPKKEEIKEELNKFKNQINRLKEEINNINNIFNEIVESLDKYYKINEEILNNYEIQNRNYQLLKNINAIKDNLKISDIDYFLNTKDINNKIKVLLNIYNKIKNKTIDIFQKDNMIGRNYRDNDKKNDASKPLDNLSEKEISYFNQISNLRTKYGMKFTDDEIDKSIEEAKAKKRMYTYPDSEKN